MRLLPSLRLSLTYCHHLNTSGTFKNIEETFIEYCLEISILGQVYP
jgi:hypothetical protein